MIYPMLRSQFPDTDIVSDDANMSRVRAGVSTLDKLRLPTLVKSASGYMPGACAKSKPIAGGRSVTTGPHGPEGHQYYCDDDDGGRLGTPRKQHVDSRKQWRLPFPMLGSQKSQDRSPGAAAICSSASGRDIIAACFSAELALDGDLAEGRPAFSNGYAEACAKPVPPEAGEVVETTSRMTKNRLGASSSPSYMASMRPRSATKSLQSEFDTCNSLVVPPNSKFRVGWDFASVTLIILDAFLLPLTLAFDLDVAPFANDRVGGDVLLQALALMSLIFWPLETCQLCCYSDHPIEA